MLKIKVSKEEHEKLPDEVKAQYKAVGELFVLDLEDYDDPAELRRARDREKLEADRAKKELDDIKKKQEEDKHINVKNSGDINALEQAWKQKVKDKEKELGDKLSKREEWARKQLVDSVAFKIASELSDKPNVLLPHIRARLDADLTTDDPVTIVLDSKGQRSASSITELREEFRGNDDFADIVRGSKAAGAGGVGKQGSGAAKKPAEMNDAERTELFKTNPQRFAQLFGTNEFYS